MNVALYTQDISFHNSNLMPWRTVIEISHYINEASGHSAIILSGNRCGKYGQIKIGGIDVYNVPKPDKLTHIKTIAKVCRENNIDILYYPIGWKLPLSKIHLVMKMADVRIVWYIPGAWYHIKRLLKSIPSIDAVLKIFLKSLVCQTLVPKRLFVSKLLAIGKYPLITMTDYNRNMLIKYGYPSDLIYSIPPGKDIVKVDESMSEERWINVKSNLKGHPYFLFFGPPHAIRGVKQILRAFEYIVPKNKDVCLVCLFRMDKGVNVDILKSKIEKLKIPQGRIFCIWNSVNRKELHNFIINSYAILKPFLLVPSEIPLAVIEAAGYGKPVIGTGPDGTGCYIEQFGLIVPPADSKALSKGMLQLINDKELYFNKCHQAKKVYADHPTWQEVAKAWLAIANKALDKEP